MIRAPNLRRVRQLANDAELSRGALAHPAVSVTRDAVSLPYQLDVPRRDLVNTGPFATVFVLWRQANLVDRLYFGYFAGLALLIAGLHARVRVWPAYLGLHAAMILAIAGLTAGSRRSRVLRFLHDWYPLAVFIVCFEEIARLSFLLVDHWQDWWLMRLEACLFPGDPVLWLRQFASPVLTEVLEAGYFSYFVLLMIVGGTLYRRQDKVPFRQVMAASVISYFACYAVYLAFPTEGPAHTLGVHAPVAGGVFHWVVLLIQRHAGVHGNAFPSSHVAAGVVAVFFAWKYAPRLAAWLTPLATLLCLGAVYDGYHYASDVIAGIAVGALAAVFVTTARVSAAGQARASGECAQQPSC